MARRKHRNRESLLKTIAEAERLKIGGRDVRTELKPLYPSWCGYYENVFYPLWSNGLATPHRYLLWRGFSAYNKAPSRRTLLRLKSNWAEVLVAQQATKRKDKRNGAHKPNHGRVGRSR